MTQSRTRGRPRKYDEGKVIDAALDVFWLKGYDKTSIDELGGAMEMNRPSIYRAFGDKEAIFLKTMNAFSQRMEAGFNQTMCSNKDIKTRLKSFLSMALDIYFGGEVAKGCLNMSTAIAASPENPEIQKCLLSIIRYIDKNLAEQFEKAEKMGQLDSKSMSAQDRAILVQGLLHTLSLRARAGDNKRTLKNMINVGVEVLAG